MRKIWRGDDAAARPERVTVQLLRDETVYDTATLSPDNGWSRTWRNLERGHRWQVVEPEVPEGYTVSVSRTGLDFTVCNTGTAEVPEEPGEVPETPVPSGKLPQTGQAWWPAAGLACMGAVLLAISAALRRRE